MKKTANFFGIIILTALIGFSIVACGKAGDQTSPGDGDFTAVSSITGVPTTGTVGQLTLSGTVNPSGATNKTIVWSVTNAGTTGASISGSTLTTTAMGIVKVRATIANGLAAGANYTQDFNIVISVSGDGSFVAVTSITGVPSAGTAGIPLALNGTVNPVNSANNDIIWSVVSVGSTGGTIIDNVLNTTAAGTITIRATIINGTAENTDYSNDFTITIYNTTALIVTSSADSGAGSFRQALADIPNDGIIIINSNVKEIKLLDVLPFIPKSVIIEGNGAILTRDASWTATSNISQLLGTDGTSGSVTVTIRRIHFKDGRANTYGGAIYNYRSNLNLESCIFTGNQTIDYDAKGGAIYNNAGNLTIKSSTFYKNKSGYRGGAIFSDYSGSTLTIQGNLFYGNTGNVGDSGRVVSKDSYSTVTSLGYNVVDVELGTGSVQCGWSEHITDKYITDLPISPISLKPFSGSEASGVITSFPGNYPLVDYFGNPIITPAAAGAIQATTGIGYFIEKSVSNNTKGNISMIPEPNTDGVISGFVSITATPKGDNTFLFWYVNGEKVTENPLNFVIAEHSNIEAVFGKIFIVNSLSDGTGSETITGTLRHAITNIDNWDIIRFEGMTPGTSIIKLNNALPPIIGKNITIDGNGVVITRDPSWILDPYQQDQHLLNFNGTVTVSRVWFKDNSFLSYTSGGGAISNHGILTLESCIFSGNNAMNYQGGAVYNSGTSLNIKGCTFYRNHSKDGARVIHNDGGTLTITGNLFYGNTTDSSNYRQVVYGSNSATVTSLGYNVVDLPLGTGNTQSGWSGHSTDKYITDLPVFPDDLKLLSGRGAIGNITSLPDDYPFIDFYGNPINAPATSGAVQNILSGNYLNLSANSSSRGSFNVTPGPNTNGLYSSGTISIEAVPTEPYLFGYWLVNGLKNTSGNPLQLQITDHTVVQAVFTHTFTVNKFTDTDAAAIPGTLRHALTNIMDNEIIRFTDVVPGTSVITLTSVLPEITKSIIIEGNGITLTCGSTWSSTFTSHLLYINSSTANVEISSIHFKNGKATTGAAIRNAGILNLESCIFSGNQTSGSNATGGAIANGNTLSIRGCTFYSNISTGSGGAISNSGTISLSGNLFYTNSASTLGGPVVYNGTSGTTESLGNNVVDRSFGLSFISGQCGFNANANGTDYILGNFLDDYYLSPFIDADGGNFAPISDLKSVITSVPENFPVTDFYGSARTFPGAPGAIK